MTNPQPTVQRMTEPHKRPHRHPKYKTAYRVKNWRAYDQSLRDRGDLTLWISQDAIDAWTPPQTGKRGAQPLYADVAIETAAHAPAALSPAAAPNRGFPPCPLDPDGRDASLPRSYDAVTSPCDRGDPTAERSS